MLSQFKKVNVIDILDEKVSEQEDLYAECLPNKFPYIFYHIKPYVLLLIFTIIIDFLYSLLRIPFPLTLKTITDICIASINFLIVFFLVKKVIETYSKVINSYYVITNKGIHITSGGKTLQYILFTYKDIKSITYNKYKLSKNRGDIYFKDITEQEPKKFYKKFLYRRWGLIGIDDANQVYNVLKQIAIQENDEIFFSDYTNTFDGVEYLQNIKKYSKRININKSDSLLDRRK